MTTTTTQTGLPGYYTTQEAADALGYAGPSTLKQACSSGKIPAFKVANVWLIPALWVDEQKKIEAKGQGARGVTRK